MRPAADETVAKNRSQQWFELSLQLVLTCDHVTQMHHEFVETAASKNSKL